MRLRIKPLLFLSALLFFSPKLARAVSIEDYSKDTTVSIHYTNTIAAATASTAAVIIDLSDAVNWPHKIFTGVNPYISITGIRVEVDKVASSTFTLKLGVVNAVDTSTGSVKWFKTVTNVLNVSNTNNSINAFPDNQFLDLKVIPPTPNSGLDGSTPFITSNDNTSGSTIYQTDVTLPSLISAGSAPGIGDVVISYTKDSTNVNILNIDIYYHIEPF